MTGANIRERLVRLGAWSTLVALCREYGVSVEEVLSPCRSRTVVACRYRFLALLRHTLDLSYPEIQAATGFDTTSGIEAVRRREAQLAEEHAA